MNALEGYNKLGKERMKRLLVVYSPGCLVEHKNELMFVSFFG